jgi:imidazolonepropionase-like amidohydrolase
MNALALIIRNGARVLGRDDRLGSIEPMQANLVLATGISGQDATSTDGVRAVMIRAAFHVVRHQEL